MEIPPLPLAALSLASATTNLVGYVAIVEIE
jgi:hypothetical protein